MELSTVVTIGKSELIILSPAGIVLFVGLLFVYYESTRPITSLYVSNEEYFCKTVFFVFFFSRGWDKRALLAL